MKAREIHFFELSDIYPTNAHTLDDLPRTIIYLNFDEKEKTVINNYDSPKALRQFEVFLEEEFAKVRWQAIAN